MSEEKKDKIFEWKDGIAFSLEENNYSILRIFFEGEEVGFAKLENRSGGIFVSNLDIYPEYQGNKYGSNLIEQVNFFIKSKTLVGYLENAIYDEKHKLYENHGWSDIGNEHMMLK